MSERHDERVVVRARSALWRTLDDALVVLGPAADKPRVITGPAASVWTLARKPVVVEDIVTGLAERHGTTPEVVRADVVRVVVVLLRDGALERVA